MDRRTDLNDVTPRRGFFTRVAASVMAIGLTGLGPVAARAAAGAEDGPDWPGTLKGRHRQVVDAYAANDGFPLAFAFTFVATNGPASAGIVPATAVVVLRHTAFPLALDHTMWQKYKIGERWKIADPATKQPAVRNIFLSEGDLSVKAMQARGTAFWQCNVALGAIAQQLAQAAGMPAADVRADLIAGLNPGVHLVPAHVMAIGIAQEHGFTYMKA